MTLLILGSKEYPMGTNVNDPLPSGGIEVYIENLVEILLKYDIDIRIITRKFEKTNVYEKLGNLEIYRVSWLKGFLLRTPTFNINSFIKALTLKYDLILSNGPIASFFSLFLSNLKGTQNMMRPAGVASVQPQYNQVLKYLLYILERYTYSHGDTIIFLSNQEKEEFRRKLNFLPERYVIIPTGVNVSKFSVPTSKKTIEEFDLDEKIVVSFVGRLIETKGVIYLIKAISLIKNDNLKVLVVGDGSEKEKLISLSNKLNLQNTIIFTGFRKDIPELLSVTDIFVLPSLSEGLPIALLEAMASECACIVTDIGLPVEDMINSLVVPPKDSITLSMAINRLLNDPQLLNDIKANARNFVRENHSWKAAGEKYIQLFQDL